MSVHTELSELHRREYGRVLASLIRKVRDITLAEECLQEAFESALVQWPELGMPPSPVGWLMSTARHKAIDQIRRRTLAQKKHEEILVMSGPEADDDDTPAPLDALRLIFTCCHPAIAIESQVALSLRTICGLSTEEIARAFVLPVPTLAQRLVRAKNKIREAGIAYEVPDDEALPERLQAVLTVVYLVFNEGYTASSGSDLLRPDLCAEAIRLARQIVELLPAQRDPKALLALMLLHDARRETRTDAQGELVLLEDQDRSRWDRTKIAEGDALISEVFRGGDPSSYALQAAIALLHAQAPSVEQTDWRQIAALYEVLLRIQPSAVIALNRAVAVAMCEGYEVGLSLLDEIDLPGYHLLPAARADFLRRLGRHAEAAIFYKEALALVSSQAERRFLELRLAEVSGPQS